MRNRLSATTRREGALALVAIFIACVPAQAHPGHDLLEHGPAHVAMSPFHLLVCVSVAVTCAGAAMFVRNTRARALLRFGATVCIALAAIGAVLNR